MCEYDIWKKEKDKTVGHEELASILLLLCVGSHALANVHFCDAGGESR